MSFGELIFSQGPDYFWTISLKPPGPLDTYTRIVQACDPGEAVANIKHNYLIEINPHLNLEDLKVTRVRRRGLVNPKGVRP